MENLKVAKVAHFKNVSFSLPFKKAKKGYTLFLNYLLDMMMMMMIFYCYMCTKNTTLLYCFHFYGRKYANKYILIVSITALLWTCSNKVGYFRWYFHFHNNEGWAGFPASAGKPAAYMQIMGLFVIKKMQILVSLTSVLFNNWPKWNNGWFSLDVLKCARCWKLKE